MAVPDILILDASVALKWFFKEEMAEEAFLLMEGLHRKEIRMVVPEIFYSEFANACWKYAKKKIIPVSRALAATDSLNHVPLESYSDRELTDVALENALRFNIPIYDGIYLALAEVYVAPLVTADRTLFNTCKDRFDFIEFLGDIKIN